MSIHSYDLICRFNLYKQSIVFTRGRMLLQSKWCKNVFFLSDIKSLVSTAIFLRKLNFFFFFERNFWKKCSVYVNLLQSINLKKSIWLTMISLAYYSKVWWKKKFQKVVFSAKMMIWHKLVQWCTKFLVPEGP